MILDEIRQPVAEHQPQIDLGISLQEIHHDRQDVQPPEDDRRGHCQFALRRTVFAGGRPFCLFHPVKNFPRRLDIGAPGLGQRDLAVASLQQFGVKMGLKLGDLAADGCQR